MAQALLGDKVKGKSGDVAVSSFCGEGTVVGLYFSAHWCPPCRGFTPTLADFYNTLKENCKALEIVFISSDRDQAAFDEYYGEMPWLALPYDNRKAKAALSEKFGISGIPTLVLLNGQSGDIIDKNGRNIVMKDPNGGKFPWK